MDSPRPAYQLHPSVRVAVAAGILFVGIVAALLFRSEVSPVEPSKSPPPEVVVHRESFPATERVASASIESAPRDTRPRLTGAIEEAPSELASPNSDRAPNDPNSSDPGSSAPWRVTDLGSAPLPGSAGLVPRNPAGTVYGSRLADEARRTHTIVDGDTLFYLAERYLGDGERYLEIFEANRDVLSDPDLLVLGAVLRIPPADAPPPSSDEQLADAAQSGALVPVSSGAPAALVAPLAEVAPSSAPPATSIAAPPASLQTSTVSVDSTGFTRPQTYRVRAGDTLVDIARRVYGDARRYLEIYEANRDRLRRPQDLREGLILSIP
jgi:nucleoid-associated protein YgaU